MSAVGIGGFAEGLSEGYERGIRQNREEAKAKREAQEFELNQRIKKAQVDEIERKAAMQEQIKRDLQALNSNAQGGVTGGTGVDEFGTEIPGLQYNNPAEAKASGLKFKEGTAVEAKPMNEWAYNRAYMDVFKKARIDNGLMDEDSWMKSMEITKKLKKEGVDDAFQTFLTTGDSNAAVQTFNDAKGGKFKAPAGTFMKREVDPKTGLVDVGIYIPGADGKPQLYTTMNQYLLMTNSDALVKHYTDMTKSKFEQGEATKRTGIETAGRIDAALITAGGKDGNSKKDRVKERIDKYAVDFAGKLATNPSVSYNIDEFQRNQPKIAARAYQYMTGSVPGQTVRYDDEALALDQATQDILGPGKKIK